jgi:hypothetical protein
MTPLNDPEPLDIIAETLGERLGLIAARIDRELKLTVSVALAEIRQEMSALRASRAESELRAARAIAEKLATLQDGPQGPQGAPGERGEPGEAITGPAGEQGIQGLPGSTGPEPYVGEVCGLYDSAREYRKYDLVSLHGAEWRARQDSPGALPGDGWALAAKAGERGKRGEIGPAGMRGLPGNPAPVIVEWAMRDYRAVPVLSDGSVGPPLDLRALFEQYHAETAE